MATDMAAIARSESKWGNLVARAFMRRLLTIVALGLAVRVVYALLAGPDLVLAGDARTFHSLANSIASGHGFVSELDGLTTADHPPLYPLYLSLFSLVGLKSWAAHRVASCLLGAATVGAVGILGRRVGGDRVGLVAAGIAAVYPLLWVNDATVLSESLYGPLIALALIAAYRVIDRPTAGRAAVLGAVVALAALTRSEALGLALLLALPVAWRARWRGLAAAAVAGALVLTPWLVRNWIAFDRPVLISNNSGSLLSGANCDATYHGRFIGLWRLDCIPPGVTGNEAEQAATFRTHGGDYARDHASRLAAGAAVRVLRTWDFYRPVDQARYETFESRNRYVEGAGVAIYYVLLALAIAGAVLLRRRRQPLWVLLAPAVLVTVASVVGYGLTRFRLAAEIPIVVLAALTLVELWRRARARRA